VRSGLPLRKRGHVRGRRSETVDRAYSVSLGSIGLPGVDECSRLPRDVAVSRCVAKGVGYRGRVASILHRLDEAVDDPVVEFLAALSLRTAW
jgi:hypothetical protein